MQNITLTKSLIDDLERYREAVIRNVRTIDTAELYKTADYQKLLHYAIYDARTAWQHGTVDND